MTRAPFEAVFFDAGNTLFTERRTRDELYLDAFSSLGLDVDLTRMTRWRVSEHDTMPERVDDEPRYSEAWFREYIRRLLRRFDSDLDAEPVRAALAEQFVHAEAYRVFDDVPAALADLRARGLRLAVVSNWSDHLDGILVGLGLRDVFEEVFASAIVGISKPDAQLFRHAVDALHLAPERVIHIGDRHDNDVIPARAAGLTAWRIDRGASGPDGETLTTFAQLAERLSA